MLSGRVGYAAATSGRAPKEKTASPMNTNPEPSPGTGSREIATLVTSMLSSAQPVTGMAPTTPVVPFIGVSNEPNGWVLGLMAAVTVTVGEAAIAVADTVTLPHTDP